MPKKSNSGTEKEESAIDPTTADQATSVVGLESVLDELAGVPAPVNADGTSEPASEADHLSAENHGIPADVAPAVDESIPLSPKQARLAEIDAELAELQAVEDRFNRQADDASKEANYLREQKQIRIEKYDEQLRRVRDTVRAESVRLHQNEWVRRDRLKREHAQLREEVDRSPNGRFIRGR